MHLGYCSLAQSHRHDFPNVTQEMIKVNAFVVLLVSPLCSKRKIFWASLQWLSKGICQLNNKHQIIFGINTYTCRGGHIAFVHWSQSLITKQNSFPSPVTTEYKLVILKKYSVFWYQQYLTGWLITCEIKMILQADNLHKQHFVKKSTLFIDIINTCIFQRAMTWQLCTKHSAFWKSEHGLHSLMTFMVI